MWSRIHPTMWLVALLIAVAGCEPSGSPSETTSPGLARTAWTVTLIGGVAVDPAATPTIAFGADGQVQGTGGCNGYGGPYKVDGQTIEVGLLLSTLILCEGPIGTQEAAFMAALRGARTWRINATGHLEIDGAGSIVATPAAPAGSPAPASGSPDADPGLMGRWALAELGPTADFANVLPTIEFAPDGTVSGFAGCNTFSGTYSTDGAALDLGPLASTKIACQRPASAVEAEYLAALDTVTGWSVEPDGRLLLEGTVPLRFVRQ